MNATPGLSPTEQARFEALAPYAGSSKLAPDDQAWLDQCAARDADLAAQLQEHRMLRTGLRSSLEQLPVAPGLERAMAALDANIPVSSPAPLRSKPSQPQALPWWRRPVPLWAPAFATVLAALALPLAYQHGASVATQEQMSRASPTSTAANLNRTPGGAATAQAVPGAQPGASSASANPPAIGAFDGPLLRLNLAPSITEQALRQALLSQGALLIGPSRLGDWYVKVAPARLAAVQAALAQSPGVASVQVVPGLPEELLHTNP